VDSVLIRTLQELRREIDELKARVAELEAPKPVTEKKRA